MIAALAVTAALAGAPEVTMPGRFFAPARQTVLVGEELTFRNLDRVNHTALGLEAGLDSGTIPPGGTYVHRFERTGTFAYLCTLHRSMRGTVEVTGLALEDPGPVRHGTSVTLRGRAPAGTGVVRLERDGVAVAETAADAAGAYSFTVPADGPAGYRARAGELASGAVRLAVAPKLRLERVAGGVRISASPAQAGARIVLERYVRERFGYLELRRATLGRDSSVTLRAPARTRLRARLARPVGGFARAVSAPLRTRRAGPAGHRGQH